MRLIEALKLAEITCKALNVLKNDYKYLVILKWIKTNNIKDYKNESILKKGIIKV